MVSIPATAKIVSCQIGPYPTGFGQPMPEVKVTFDNGESKTLFDFYPDEISFTEVEFIGLTEREATQLKHTKDVAYLRS